MEGSSLNLAEKAAPAAAASAPAQEAQDPRKNFNYALVKVRLSGVSLLMNHICTQVFGHVG
jgi:hypothetical protein